MSDRPSDDERKILRALFIANECEQRPTATRFRIKHKAARASIDRLIERKFIAGEGERYRLTLRGLHAADLEATRTVIAVANEAIPALQALYERNGPGNARMPDVLRTMESISPVDPEQVNRALWYLLAEIRGISGWTRDTNQNLTEVGLSEGV